MLYNTLLTLVALSLHYTSATAHKLYYTIGHHEVQLYNTHNTVVTLDQYTTINDIQHTIELQQLLHTFTPLQCTLSHTTVQYKTSTPLYSILQQHAAQFELKHATTATDVHVVDSALLQSEQPLQLQCNNILYNIYNNQRQHAITQHEQQHIIQQANNKQLEQRMYPFDALQIMGQTLSSDWSWLTEFVKHHWGELHPFITYSDSDTGIYHLNTGKQLNSVYDVSATDSDTAVHIAIASDWAAGTFEADLIAYAINDGIDPRLTNHDVTQLSSKAYDWTIHAGDVYYIGLESEVQSNFLGNISHITDNPPVKGVTFPYGQFGTFALSGNHEMFSRGYGYFDTLLPKLGLRDTATNSMTGQQTSYNVLVNQYWRVVNLDTGYNSYSTKIENHNNVQPNAVVEWLKQYIKLDNVLDKRGIVLITHHQPTSAFLDPYLATVYQLLNEQLIVSERTILWLWGHEHRLGLYAPQTLSSNNKHITWYGRCVGNSGFPPLVVQLPVNARDSGLLAFDDRVYMNASSTFGSLQMGYNGYTSLKLHHNLATITYYTLSEDSNGVLQYTNPTVMAKEQFLVDFSGNVRLMKQELHDEMTKVLHVDNRINSE